MNTKYLFCSLKSTICNVLTGFSHHQVLVKVYTSGVCHTDIHVRDGDWHIKSKLPMIPGHEGAGVVVKVADWAMIRYSHRAYQ